MATSVHTSIGLNTRTYRIVQQGAERRRMQSTCSFTGTGQAREELNVRLDGGIESETIVRFMLEKEENWSAVSSFVKDIMTKLREEEQSRRKVRELETIAPRVMQRRLTDFWKY
uniref:Uncharacterized protein n=1 Tax=Bracon brevicornis TaxID=1563983 RepID=A0A6V7LXR6_9HYME